MRDGSSVSGSGTPPGLSGGYLIPSEQLADRFPIAEDGDGPAAEILELVPAVDPQMVIHGRQEVFRCQRTVLRMLTLAVGRAHNTPRAQGAALRSPAAATSRRWVTSDMLVNLSTIGGRTRSERSVVC